MCRSSSESGQGRDVQIQDVVLRQIAGLHPGRLTSDELVVWLEDRQTHTSRTAIEEAISVLKRSGLLRQNGEVVEPTFAALRAVAILQG